MGSVGAGEKDSFFPGGLFGVFLGVNFRKKEVGFFKKQI